MTPSPSTTQPIHDNPDELLRRHLPLAYRLAACYRGSGERYEDLVKAAEIGLVQAAEGFDPEAGRPFDTFASPVVAAELSRFLHERKARSRDRCTEQRIRQVARAERRISKALAHGSRVRDLGRLLALDADVLADGLLAAAARESVTLNLPVQRRGGAHDPGHGFSATPAAA